MKTLLVYAKNYGKFPKNFIHNILWGCFYESCVAFHRNYTDRKQYIFREKTAHQAEAAPSAAKEIASKTKQFCLLLQDYPVVFIYFL